MSFEMIEISEFLYIYLKNKRLGK